MSNRLYVGNLPFHATEELLSQRFAASGGVVSVSVVIDRDTGRSRGFGFVEMASREDGEKAIAELNGKELDGRELKVNEAKPQESRGGGGRGGYGGGGGRGNRGGGGGYGGGYGGGGNRW